ncbi:MAG: serine/threonine-protein kinase, partial [Candidatus Binatia bacterium]
MSGEIFANRYLVGAELGVGGMGMVYEAQDLRTHGRVALKVLHPWLAREQDFVARLHREAEVAASIDSPRVVRILDVDFHEGRPFLVMEYLPGPTLAERIAEAGRLPWREVVAVGVEIGRALEAAHAKRVYHRDLSPRNIKIADGQVKVLDFGIARAEGSATITATGVVMGSMDYCAPERLGGAEINASPEARRGDARSDIYSLGAILYEALAGRKLFLGEHAWAIIRGHLSLEPDPLPADVPSALAEVVLRCLRKQPAERYTTAAALVAALQSTLSDDPHRTGAPPPVTSPAAPGPPPATDQVTRTVAVGRAAEQAARSGSAVPTDRAAFAAESANSAANGRRGR